MAKASEVICGNCKKWQAPETGTTGQCHAHPPTVVVHATITGAWAPTEETGWCDEFEAGSRKKELDKEKEAEEEKAAHAAKAHATKHETHAKSGH